MPGLRLGPSRRVRQGDEVGGLGALCSARAARDLRGESSLTLTLSLTLSLTLTLALSLALALALPLTLPLTLTLTLGALDGLIFQLLPPQYGGALSSRLQVSLTLTLALTLALALALALSPDPSPSPHTDLNQVRKQAIIEKLISHRFFRRKQGLPRMAKHMEQQRHRILYAEDILRLNQGMCAVCAW